MSQLIKGNHQSLRRLLGSLINRLDFDHCFGLDNKLGLVHRFGFDYRFDYGYDFDIR